MHPSNKKGAFFYPDVSIQYLTPVIQLNKNHHSKYTIHQPLQVKAINIMVLHAAFIAFGASPLLIKNSKACKTNICKTLCIRYGVTGLWQYPKQIAAIF